MSFKVTVGGTVERPTINVSGSSREPATWIELADWGINWNQIYNKINAGWGHRLANLLVQEAEVQERWGDQSFARYGWQPATICMAAVDAKIIKETNEPFAVVVDEYFHEGPSDEGEYATQIDYQLARSVETNWSRQLSVGQAVEVGVEVGGEAVGAKASVKSTTSMEVTVGQGGSKTVQDATTVSRYLKTTLKKGERALAKVTATKGSLVAAVNYMAWLEGGFWLDFGRRVNIPGRGAHYFFYDPITAHTGGKIQRTQIIDIDFYHRATAGWMSA